MNISAEKKAYRSLIQNKLGFSGGTKLILEGKFSTKQIFEAMDMCEIVMDYSYVSRNVREEAKRIYLTLANLLVALPGGNAMFVATCFRQLSEELLRMAYFHLIAPEFDATQYLPFVELWENGLKTDAIVSDKCRTLFNQLACMFKENSILLHNISANSTSAIDYLDNLISISSIDSISTVNSYIRTTRTYLIVQIPTLLNLQPKIMTMPQRHEFVSLTS